MKRLGLLICALAIGLGAPNSAEAGHRRDQGPPPWAPAHGYRHKHEKRHHVPVYQHKHHHKHHSQRIHHHHFHHRHDRHDIRWRVAADRWKFHQRESAIIAGVVGGALGSLLSSSAMAAVSPRAVSPRAVSPRHAPSGHWAPPHAAPAPSFFSSDGGQPASSRRYCREFSRDALISGRPREIYGLACWQPDGSWEVVSVKRR
jgi:surface antigen